MKLQLNDIVESVEHGMGIVTAQVNGEMKVHFKEGMFRFSQDNNLKVILSNNAFKQIPAKEMPDEIKECEWIMKYASTLGSKNWRNLLEGTDFEEIDLTAKPQPVKFSINDDLIKPADYAEHKGVKIDRVMKLLRDQGVAVRTHLSKVPREEYDKIEMQIQTEIRSVKPAKSVPVIKELSSDIPELLEQVKKLSFPSNAIAQEALRGWQGRLERIDRYYGQKNYRVVFIGKPGGGKTTAICNWLNLIHIEQKSEPKKSYDLLSTGSGKTTVAEVHIKQVDGKSRIRLELLPIEEQEKFIRDFCGYCYYGYNPKASNAAMYGSGTISTEILSAVCNMAGMTLPDFSDELKREQFNKRYSSSAALFERVSKIINLEKRTCNEILHEGDDFDKWLSETFNNVNFGKHPECSIPKTIYVDVGRDDKVLNLPDYVDEVIDTLGLDTDKAGRPDLVQFMQAPDTLCLMVDELGSVPSENIRHIIKNAFVDYSEYRMEKVALYVRATEDELKKVPDANGDVEQGILKKKNQIHMAVVSDDPPVPYCVANTKFIDSKTAYKICSETEEDDDGDWVTIEQLLYSTKRADKQRDEINVWLKSLIDGVDKRLKDDALAVRNSVDELRKAEEKNDEAILAAKIASLKKKFEESKEKRRTNFFPVKVIDYMVNPICGLHPQTLRGLNNRYGAWKPYKFKTDVYSTLSKQAQSKFGDAMKGLQGALNEVLTSGDADVDVIMKGYKERMNILRSSLIQTFETSVLEWLLSESSPYYPRSNDSAFWNTVINRFGQGPGFVSDVAKEYKGVLLNREDVIKKMFMDQYDSYTREISTWLNK